MASTFEGLSSCFGDSNPLPPEWRGRRSQCRGLLAFFQSRFPGPVRREVAFGFVPGRIEVFGRHTDYAGGRSIVCAIDRGFLFAASPNKRGTVRMAEDSQEFEPVEFAFGPSITPRRGHWANYPMTMARRLARNFGRAAALRGADIAFSSTLPVGSGMSGSSALMMMTFAALASLDRLREAAPFRENLRGPVDLAVYLACAENGQSFRGLRGGRGVGTFGGSEDHAAILTARPGLVSLFGFCPASLVEEIPWPQGWKMVVAFSGVRAEKTREARDKYNLASRRARDAVGAFNEAFGTRFSTLREVVDRAAGMRGGAWIDGLDSARHGAPGLGDRVRQFMAEDRRHIPEALRALREMDLESFGKLLSASHRESKRWLWNIVPEIDFLQHLALRLGAAGASGFGAGFGGSIFAVVPAGGARTFLAAWQAGYARRSPALESESAFFVTSPGPGIEVWDRDGPRRLVDLLFQVQA